MKNIPYCCPSVRVHQGCIAQKSRQVFGVINACQPVQTEIEPALFRIKQVLLLRYRY